MIEPVKPRLLRDRDHFRRWYLDEDAKVTLANGHTLIIPKGYRFDGHSVPVLLRWLFPKRDGDDVYAALVHDYLIDVEMFLRYNRKFQDLEYWRFMDMPEYFTSSFRRFILPRAVRAWGYLLWDIWGDDRGEIKPESHFRARVYADEDTATELA
ncbi:MAG: DUF1353 domain-containing protein [Pseudomonadota bacterium]